MEKLMLGEICVDVVQKDIKNIHLSVYPPTGKVRISAPLHMKLDTIRLFAISKLSWIKKQQAKLRSQEREAPRDYIARESHYYLGKRYLLRVIEQTGPAKVILKHDTLELHVSSEADTEKRQSILTSWYRLNLKLTIPDMITKWERIMQVQVNEFGVKRMKTRWGTCNIEDKRIWLNLELAKKPLRCLEFIVVHEMAHLLERRHNERFTKLMDSYMPNWRHCKQELNQLPIGHADWDY